MDRVRVLTADITGLTVDAIVNAANERLLGGVYGAIHRAAGPQLLDACRMIPAVRPGVRCPTGECRITPGFHLPAKYVIHAVGPIWRGGSFNEAELLASCYECALSLAVQHGLRSIAFPAISCGVFGFPVDQAAAVVHQVLTTFLAQGPALEEVILVVFGADVEEALRARFG